MADSTEQLQHTAELDARVDQLLRDMDAKSSQSADPDDTVLAAPKAETPAIAPNTADDLSELDARLSRQAEQMIGDPALADQGALGPSSTTIEPPASTSRASSWIADLGEDEFTTIEAVLGEVADEVEAANEAREAQRAGAKQPEDSKPGPTEQAEAAADGHATEVENALNEPAAAAPAAVPDSTNVAGKPAAEKAPEHSPKVLAPAHAEPSAPEAAPAAASPLPKTPAPVPEPAPPTAAASASPAESAPPKPAAPAAPDPAESIEQLDEALAANAEKAVESAPVQSGGAATEPVAANAANAPAAPAAQPAPPTPAAASSPAPEARPAPSTPPAQAAPAVATPAPTPDTTTMPPDAVVETKPRAGLGTLVARVLWPIASMTDKLPASARQTLGYAAVVTLFNAACLWGFITFRSSDHADEHAAGGVRFLHADDPAPAPTSRGDKSHDDESSGHKAEKADGHGAPKPAAKKKDAHGGAGGGGDSHGKSTASKPSKSKSTKSAKQADKGGGHGGH